MAYVCVEPRCRVMVTEESLYFAGLDCDNPGRRDLNRLARKIAPSPVVTALTAEEHERCVGCDYEPAVGGRMWCARCWAQKRAVA